MPNYALLKSNGNDAIQMQKPLNLYVNFFFTLLVFFFVDKTFFDPWEPKDKPSTKVDFLVNAVDVLFPNCSNSSNSDTTESDIHAYSIRSRPDIKSFAYDLGGTTCACQLKWDANQYWQRVFYGPKYVLGHSFTPFVGVFFFYDFKWVILWKYVNEIAEEIALPVYSRWARGGTEPVFNLESRYDTMINDMLGGVFFIILGKYCVKVLEIEDNFTMHTNYDFNRIQTIDDLAQAILKIFIPFLQFWAFSKISTFLDIFGHETFKIWKLRVDSGILVTLLIGVVFLHFFTYINKWEMQKVSLFSGTLALLFVPFIFILSDNYDHQITALLAFAIPAVPLIVYDIFHNGFSVTNSVMSVITLAALVLWSIFDVIVKRPEDSFYFHGGWCGLSPLDSLSANSCASVIL